MVEELKEVNSQGFGHGCDDDNYLWIIVAIVILFLSNSGGGIFGGCGSDDNNWIWILIIIFLLFSFSGKGFGNILGGLF